MSRSNNTELINPAIRFFDWSGEEGKIRYFDKTLGEKGENVDVPLPFKFLCLDRVAQITGGIDRNGKYEGFWSNAVRNLKTQGFVVKSKAGVEAQGLYEHIKGTPGVKFMTGLYIAFYDENAVLQIGYLKIKGAALTAWIEFTKFHRDIYAGAFAITGNNQCKKGTNTYYEPVFAHSAKVSEESDDAAKNLDVQLQEYLSAYFAQSGIEEVEVQFSGQSQAVAANGAVVGTYADPQAPVGGFNPSDAQDDDDIPF